MPEAQRVQRALGLDYGRRTVGLAVSTLGLAPRPLEGLPGCGFDGQAALAADVLAVARREGCDAVVVGLPVTQAGSLRQRETDSQQGRRCRNFAQNLAAAAAAEAASNAGGGGGSSSGASGAGSSRGSGTMRRSGGGSGRQPLLVFLADEQCSTMVAKQALAASGRRSSSFGKVKDSVAAAVILEAFFDNPSAALLVRPHRSQGRQPGDSGSRPGRSGGAPPP